MRNITGRENLITYGQTNELAHALFTGFYLYSFKHFMAIRTGIDGTTTLPGSMASDKKHDIQVGKSAF